ncbi:ABC transporter ATP-binding protein [Paraburkholderia tropica]|uniref:ABC transporter ATP-binding protein n=1 Tax=Paraburkholderia tropica TaxID=92647 RepID=UPI002AB6F043|nr:ABC transporter ATP-binding protein [Paraburkholderia tropica]
MKAETVLSVEQLNLEVGARRLVQDLSFSIGRNETLALVGESGSGKTLTSLSIMRLLPSAVRVTSGRIRFGDDDVLTMSPKQVRNLCGNRISMIFQEPMSTLNPVMPVGRQVLEVLRAHRAMTNAEAEKEVVRLFERVRIPDAKRRIGDYPHAFSGGMRQRIVIAAAIVCKPSLLIADEPTTALDVTVQAQVLALLRELQDEYGMSMLFITHDMGVVATIADRVIVMKRGEIVEAGGTHGIFEQPAHRYTQELIGSSFSFERIGAPPHDPASLQRVDANRSVVLRVQGLTTRFDVKGGLLGRTVGRVHAVEDVSFALAKGETLAVVGESGSGKSTTGRALLGLNTPSAGTIEYRDRVITRFSPADVAFLRRGVQMVFQDPYGSLDPRMKIGDAIAEPLICRGLCKSRSEALERTRFYLTKVGLDGAMAERLPHEFSGGQRQRISIAKAVSLAPDVLVADEAVSALDVTTKVRIIELLKALQDEYRMAMIFISHDIAAVSRVADRIAVMYRGRIVEIGPRDAVLRAPAHAYTQRLLSATLSADTSRRQLLKATADVEQTSPLHPLDYQHPPCRIDEVGDDHFILVAA